MTMGAGLGKNGRERLKRGRKPLAASVVRLEIRVPLHLARMAEERAASRGITTAELWREAMHAHLGRAESER